MTAYCYVVWALLLFSWNDFCLSRLKKYLVFRSPSSCHQALLLGIAPSVFLSHNCLLAQFCRVMFIQNSFIARVLFTFLQQIIHFVVQDNFFTLLFLALIIKFLIVNPRISILIKSHFRPRSSSSTYFSLKKGKFSHFK